MDRRTFLKSTALLSIYFALPLNIKAQTINSFSNTYFSLNQNPKLYSWLKFLKDGTIIVKTGKVELGQGIKTALIQIAAEELNVSLNNIKIISGDTKLTPDEMYTAGSFSVEHSGTAIKHAAGFAMELILDEASKYFKTDKSFLISDNGFVYPRTTPNKKKTYIDLLGDNERIYHLNINKYVKTKNPNNYTIVGKNIQRIEGEKLTNGQEYFIHDIYKEDLLYARVIRPHFYFNSLNCDDFHAIIKKFPSIKLIKNKHFLAAISENEEELILSVNSIRRMLNYVKAENDVNNNNLYEYMKSLESIDINVTSKEKHMPIHEATNITATYKKPYTAHASLGPSLALAFYNNNNLTIYTHSQGVFPLRAEISKLLKMDPSKIHIIHKLGAGCYGHNGADDVALDAALIAMEVPNKWIKLQWDRTDEFIWEPYGSPMIINLNAKLNKEKKIISLYTDIISDTHSTRPMNGGCLIAEWHINNGLPKGKLEPMEGAYRNATPLYDIPNIKIDTHFIDTPLRVSALRSLGALGNIFALESFIDECAFHTQSDPLVFRLNHLKDKRAINVINTVKNISNYTYDRSFNGNGVGLAFAQYKNHAAYVAVVVKLSIQNNRITLNHIYAASDMGIVINPDGAKNQLEGGIVQALSIALLENINIYKGNPNVFNYDSYPIITFNKIPPIDIVIIENKKDQSVGAGEASMGPTVAAVCNAIFNATGKRIRELPISKFINI